jgi:DNA-binding transcriptional LysR family regulator
MSRALQRLRRVLDDALLIRSTEGYRLIPAREPDPPPARHGDSAESLLAAEAFNPREASQSIHLAGTDYPAAAFGPAICREILAQSPQSTVQFHSWGEGVADQIKRGRVDLGFYGGYIPDDLSSTDAVDREVRMRRPKTIPSPRSRRSPWRTTFGEAHHHRYCRRTTTRHRQAT